MKFNKIILLISLVAVYSATSFSQTVTKLHFPPIDWKTGWAAGVNLSTTGPGIQAVKEINKNWNARLGFSLLPLTISQSIDQGSLALAIDAKIRTGGINLQADFFLSEWYYFTGGLWTNFVKADLDVQLSDAVEFGDISISPEQIGTFNVLAKTGWPINPYLGVGFGNPMPQGDRKFWFNVELGTWYHHKPRFKLDAFGMINPTANESNEKALKENFKGFRFYPYFSIQGNYRIF